MSKLEQTNISCLVTILLMEKISYGEKIYAWELQLKQI